MAVYLDIATGQKKDFAPGVDPSNGDPQSNFQLMRYDGSTGQFMNSNSDVIAAQQKVLNDPAYQAANQSQNQGTNLGGADSFQISSGDQELQNIIAAILDAWNRGDYGTNPSAALQEISRQSGMSVDDLTATGGIWDDIKGNFVAPVGSQNIPTPVQSATAVPVPPVVNLSRAALLREQSDTEALRRIRATNFGPLAPLGQRAANSILNQFFGQQPITNMAGLTPREDAFSQFRQAPPTAASLTSALGDIRAAGTSSPGFFNRFLDEQGQPLAGAARDAFSASIQPMLSGINPSYRAGYGRFLGNQFADRAAINPGSYQTPDQILDLMTNAFTGF